MTEEETINGYPTFKVGDGATVTLYTDSHACTVIAVSKSGKTITLQRDKATLGADFKPKFTLGGFAGHCTNQHEQYWTYEPDPNGKIYSARLGKFGWKVGGLRGLRVTRGRHEFHDYNF